MNQSMNELHRDIPSRKNPPTEDLPPTELEQPDPQLALSTGRATALQIALTAIATILILGVMIYGLNRPLNEPGQIASAPPAPGQETTGAAPQGQPAQPAAQEPQNEPAQQPQPELVKPAQPDDSNRSDTPAR
jgi:hypothetical protein